jgi:hypothetical protein
MHLGFLLILISFSSLAHQTSLTSSGRELFWANTDIPVTVRTNTSDMSPTDINSIVVNSFAQWNQATSANVGSVGSSQNEIKFVSNFPYGSGVIGITEVSYNSVGAISKAVISLNDDYTLQSSPGQYFGTQIFLGDVVTHEVGHLLGLSHSEVLNSSMFYANFAGQSTVALDDRSGIKQKYDDGFGTISGQVKGGQHVGVLGVHVQAISRKTGEASAAVTDENGSFSLGGLDLNDTYYLYTSPIKNLESLPGYFSNVQDSFCPASYVGSFFNGCGRAADGKPHGITLADALPAIDVGTVSINCSLRSDEAYSYQKLQTTFAPVEIFNYQQEQRYEKAFVGWFRAPSTDTWSPLDVLNIDLSGFAELSGTTKYLKISLVSYPFGNQLEYQMTVKKNGFGVPAATRALTGPFANGTYNTDFESLILLSATQAQNIFEVSLKSRKLTPSLITQTYPASLEFSTDQHLPYLLIVSIWEQSGGVQRPLLDSAVNLSDNESCLDAPYTYAVSRANTPKDESSRNNNQSAAAAGCGTIEPPKNGPTSSLPLLSLGFFLSFLASTLIKSRKKFLS